MLESGLANDVVGESAADSSLDCKPDPIALQKTQDLLQARRGVAGRRGDGAAAAAGASSTPSASF